MLIRTTSILLGFALLTAPAAFAQDGDVDGAKEGVVFPENPTRADRALELQRLRREGIAQYEAGLSLEDATDRFERAWRLSGAADDAFNVALVHFRQNDPETMRRWLETALEADPNHPNALYLLGVQAKEEGDFKAARDLWLRTVERNPVDAQLHYQLALVQRSLGDEAGFVQSLINALGVDPDHPGALYQMFRHYRVSGNREAADSTMARFRAIKGLERFSRREKAKEPSRLAAPIAGVLDASNPFVPTDMRWEVAETPLPCLAARVFTVPQPSEDLLDLEERRLTVCEDGRVMLGDAAAQAIGSLPAGAGQIETATLDASGHRLVVRAGGRLRISSPVLDGELSFADAGAADAEFRLADIDVDGDVDVVFFGGALPLVNVNDLAFKEEPEVYADGALVAALEDAHDAVPLDIRRNGMADFAVVGEGTLRLVAGGVLGYEIDWEIGGDFGAGTTLAVADLDANGRMDVILQDADAISVVWNPEIGAGGRPVPLVEGEGGITGVLAADFNNDSLIDLAAARGALLSIHLNAGDGTFAEAQDVRLPAAGALLARDPDGDGRLDLSTAAGDRLVTATNRSDTGNALRVLLRGVRSAHSGRMSQLEVRSGIHYSYHQSQGGIVHAGIGTDEYAEIVRIEWTNGFIENKLLVRSAESPFVFEESERISGSCPSVFTWDGERFRYISDAFISGPMGVPVVRGVYFPITDRETMVIDGEAMRPLDGTLQMRFTEELLETVYLDRIELAVVEHPEASVIAPHSRLAAPPADGEFYVARSLVSVANVLDQNGKDQTEAVARRDGVHADNVVMDRRNIGFAEPNSLTFTLPEGVEPQEVDALAARGWFYYFDSTSMIGAAQDHGGEIGFPMLEQRIDGTWVRVGPVGVPSGKDKVALMPLAGQLESRELRLSSGIAVHWDELALSLGDISGRVSTEILPLTEANLRFRGLSHMTRRNPEIFDYHRIRYDTLWNPMVGAYSSYGAVDEMVDEADGVYAIFGTGDEIAFHWEPPTRAPRAGMKHTYLLRFVGYVKDGDRYTSDSNRVDPLPYLGMSSYPASAPEGYRHPLAEMRRTRRPFDFTLSAMSKDQGS